MSSLLPGLLYLTAIAAFGVVVWWSARNDAPGLQGGDKGLLAMSSERRKSRPSKDRGKWERDDSDG